MLELTAPTVHLHPAWLEAHHEWGPGLHEDGFGVRADDDLESPHGFAAFVARVSDRPEPATADRFRSRCRWIVEDGRVHGGIALRSGPDDYVRRFGHLGYGVRPSSRRRGLATWALGQMLGEARGFGLERLLVVCEAGNLASARTIEHNGGFREAVQSENVAGWRYWITTTDTMTGHG